MNNIENDSFPFKNQVSIKRATFFLSDIFKLFNYFTLKKVLYKFLKTNHHYINNFGNKIAKQFIKFVNETVDSWNSELLV